MNKRERYHKLGLVVIFMAALVVAFGPSQAWSGKPNKNPDPPSGEVTTPVDDACESAFSAGLCGADPDGDGLTTSEECNPDGNHRVAGQCGSGSSAGYLNDEFLSTVTDLPLGRRTGNESSVDEKLGLVHPLECDIFVQIERVANSFLRTQTGGVNPWELLNQTGCVVHEVTSGGGQDREITIRGNGVEQHAFHCTEAPDETATCDTGANSCDTCSDTYGFSLLTGPNGNVNCQVYAERVFKDCSCEIDGQVSTNTPEDCAFPIEAVFVHEFGHQGLHTDNSRSNRPHVANNRGKRMEQYLDLTGFPNASIGTAMEDFICTNRNVQGDSYECADFPVPLAGSQP